MNTIKEIKTWFETAVPVPTEDSKRVQLGVHAEEFVEMLDEIEPKNFIDLSLPNTRESLEDIASEFKANKELEFNIIDRENFLDALCDGIVTAVGVAHMYGFDIESALQEVSDSNNSKFVDGKPIFNEHGKIMKGPNYFRPDLSKFV